MSFLSLHIMSLRQRTGMNQEQFAKRLGVGTTTVKNLETGYLDCPPAKLLEDIARVFNTTVVGLLGRETLQTDEAVFIHVVSSIEAGKPLVSLDRVVGGVFMDRDKMHRYKHFGIIVNDNALKNRNICAGYTAIIRVGAPVKNNDIVLAWVDGIENPVVRVYHKAGNTVILKTENESDLYSDITLSCDERKFDIVGKVIKCEFYL